MMLDLLHHALGPDVESLDEILFDVGRRHAALGLCDEPELFEIMLSCLVEVVDELVGLSDQAQKAWKVVTNALVTSLSTAVQATKWEEQQRHSTRESRRNGQLLPASPTSVRRGSDW
jgi:hemoglobin-like flavoprotein